MNTLKLKLMPMIFVSFSLIWIIISSLVLAQVATVAINSFQGETPTIDGIIDAEEEQGTGKPIKILLSHDPWDLVGSPRTMEIKLGASHSNDSYLYINTVVNYRKIVNGYMMYFMRKNGTNDNFDMKRVSSETEDCYDGFRNNTDSWWEFNNDTSFSGTEDLEVECSITEKDITFELRIPFNSGDLAGNDLNIKVGDVLELGLYLYLQYENGETSYGRYIHNFLTITMQNTTATIPLPRIGIVLALMLVTGIVVKKRKKKNS